MASLVWRGHALFTILAWFLVQLFASVVGSLRSQTCELLKDPARVLVCPLLPMAQEKMIVCSGSSASGVSLDSGITLP